MSFLKFNDNKLTLNHLFICKNISFIVILKSSKLGLVTIKLVSSAYKILASAMLIWVNHLRVCIARKTTDQESSLAEPHV
jgi:hypothetical protein